MSASIWVADGRMSISAPVTPSASISRQAFVFVVVEVANPGMVYPSTLRREQPSSSIARQATSSAWVESRPPEMPRTTFSMPVERRRVTRPWIWMR